MLQYHTLLSILCSIICQLVAYGRLKTKENFKLLAIKVVAVAYKKWLLTSGSKHSDLTCKLLVFWKSGCWGEVVAKERWSQPEVQLYLTILSRKSHKILKTAVISIVTQKLPSIRVQCCCCKVNYFPPPLFC